MNGYRRTVRQPEQDDRWSEHDGTERPARHHRRARCAAERERVGLSLTELARRAGLAKSTLSQLESGTGNPSVETLWALAVALDVPFSRLVEPPPPPSGWCGPAKGRGSPAEQADFAGTLLAAGTPHTRRDIYVITVEPGAGRQAQPHIPGTVEHLIVSAGRIRHRARGPTDRTRPG